MVTASRISAARSGRTIDPGGLTEHCDKDEYAAFLDKLVVTPEFRRMRRRWRREFIERWPDLEDWLSEPLDVRVGRLHGEKQKTASYPISFRARSYLFYLALTDRLRLDYDFLLSIGYLRARDVADALGIDFGIADVSAHGAQLGYYLESVTSSLLWVLPRIALHTGIRTPDSLSSNHLEEIFAAAKRYENGHDRTRFHGPTETFKNSRTRCWASSVRTLQLILHHRGRPLEAPRMIPSKRRSLPSPRPDMQAAADRWLEAKGIVLAKATVLHAAVSLRRFIEHLSTTFPEMANFGAVKPTHMTSFLEAMTSEPRPRTGRPVSITSRRARAGTVARFLSDGAAWGWENFPTRPVLDVRDLPRLPNRVPRFIPGDQLPQLMDAIRALSCPYQRAALLTARWSGARRSEITRLPLDCLDRYPDGTARLRIPAGKTMKERMVPLHEEAAEALRAVIALRSGGPERPVADDRTGDLVRFVFFRRGVRISTTYLFQYALADACRQAGLVDGQGQPTVSAHRFRHTVGTQLAERGAKLHTIMSVLGHQTPHMAMVYARISDAEVLRDYQSVLGPGAAIAGPGAEAIRSGQLSVATVDWLRSNFLKTELELGHCLRLPSEGPCECDLYLTCAKFVTTPAYAPRLRERHCLELTLAEDARQRQWTREVERHSGIARRVENLLADLGEPLALAERSSNGSVTRSKRTRKTHRSKNGRQLWK
jgi:integrase